MRVKKYQAADMPAAMTRIRAELGPDAIILHTQKKRPGGWLGFLRRPSLEVIAAVDTDLRDFPQPTQAATNDIQKMQQELAAMKMTLSQVTGSQETVARIRQAPPENSSSYPISPVASIDTWYRHLIEQGVTTELAQQIIRTVADELNRWALDNQAVLNEHLHWHLGRSLTPPQPLTLKPGHPRVCFIVGPTGVGKTTTIAKLAANFSKAHHARVMMISADTFRVAAIPQITTFGQILDVPVEVAYTPQQLAALVEHNSHHDLILVDTPGRSQRAAAEVDELNAYLAPVFSKSVHLAITAGTKYDDMRQIVNVFGSMPLDGLIFTKTDETVSFGPAYSLACETGLPLSYLTNGQRVPEDIQIASAERVIDLLVGPVPDDLRSTRHLNGKSVNG